MTVESTHPWTGAVQYRYDYQGDAAVEAALAKADAAFGPWAALPLEKRSGFLRAAGAALWSANFGLPARLRSSATRWARLSLLSSPTCVATKSQLGICVD